MSVYRHRTREYEPWRAVFAAPLDQAEGRHHVPLKIADRVIEADLTRGLTGEMEDGGDTLGKLLNDLPIGEVTLDEINLGRNVVEFARRQVIDTEHAEALADQPCRKGSADEPSCAGYHHRLHGLTLGLQACGELAPR